MIWERRTPFEKQKIAQGNCRSFESLALGELALRMTSCWQAAVESWLHERLGAARKRPSGAKAPVDLFAFGSQG
jgi:hypothetical protein